MNNLNKEIDELNKEIGAWVRSNIDDGSLAACYQTAPLDEIPHRELQGLKIDWDTADSITKANLLDALDCAKIGRAHV